MRQCQVVRRSVLLSACLRFSLALSALSLHLSSSSSASWMAWGREDMGKRERKCEEKEDERERERREEMKRVSVKGDTR